MVNTAMKIREVSEEIKNEVLKELVVSDEFMELNASGIEVLKKAIVLLDLSLDLNEKFAKSLVDINAKLDKLMLI